GRSCHAGLTFLRSCGTGPDTPGQRSQPSSVGSGVPLFPSIPENHGVDERSMRGVRPGSRAGTKTLGCYRECSGERAPRWTHARPGAFGMAFGWTARVLRGPAQVLQPRAMGFPWGPPDVMQPVTGSAGPTRAGAIAVHSAATAPEFCLQAVVSGSWL